MGVKRLDRLLSEAGLASRRELKEIIRRGRVTVDGVAAVSGDMKVSEKSIVLFDGQAVNPDGRYYILLNKPAGYVSATEDEREKTVLDLLPGNMRRAGVFPVGRLDKDTQGLLLLTNDGPWAHGIASPKRHVKKTYRAEAEGALTEKEVEAFREGLTLKDGDRCLPAKLEILSSGETSLCLVTVEEGKYHQVKRMLAGVGHRVIALERISVGGLTLDGSLKRGEYRPLTEAEVKMFTETSQGI